jgi:hypothetical protein
MRDLAAGLTSPQFAHGERMDATPSPWNGDDLAELLLRQAREFIRQNQRGAASTYHRRMDASVPLWAFVALGLAAPLVALLSVAITTRAENRRSHRNWLRQTKYASHDRLFAT